jgi:hypothetical protein
MQNKEYLLEQLKTDEPYHYDLIILKEQGDLPTLESLTGEQLRVLCHDYGMPDSEIADLFGVSKDKVRKIRYSLDLNLKNRIFEDVVGIFSEKDNVIIEENAKLKEEIDLLKMELEKLKKKVSEI